MSDQDTKILSQLDDARSQMAMLQQNVDEAKSLSKTWKPNDQQMLQSSKRLFDDWTEGMQGQIDKSPALTTAWNRLMAATQQMILQQRSPQWSRRDWWQVDSRFRRVNWQIFITDVQIYLLWLLQGLMRATIFVRESSIAIVRFLVEATLSKATDVVNSMSRFMDRLKQTTLSGYRFLTRTIPSVGIQLAETIFRMIRGIGALAGGTIRWLFRWGTTGFRQLVHVGWLIAIIAAALIRALLDLPAELRYRRYFGGPRYYILLLLLGLIGGTLVVGIVVFFAEWLFSKGLGG
jgi:hypothetical protein